MVINVNRKNLPSLEELLAKHGITTNLPKMNWGNMRRKLETNKTPTPSQIRRNAEARKKMSVFRAR
jgi:hypothetical protein